MAQRVQRLAAYAVITRGDRILLSRLSSRVTQHELWSLPGGGVDHGEAPRDAVVREVYEETGLDATVGDIARVYSLHLPDTWRRGRRVDAHSVRVVYEGWVAPDAPEPHVVEIDGSTAEARWQPIAAVLDGTLPTVSLVTAALADHVTAQRQRVGAYGYAVDGGRILLTRNSPSGPLPGVWNLPGGGIDHGETPIDTVVRELWEECGLDAKIGDLLTVTDRHFTGTAPNGREEDFHAIQVVYRVEVAANVAPRVVETGGTTDAVAWVPFADVDTDAWPVTRAVVTAMTAAGDSPD